MAAKKRPVTTPKKPAKPHGEHAQQTPMVLTKAALDDLHYLEPVRTRDRVIGMLNELYAVVLSLQQQHAPSDH